MDNSKLPTSSHKSSEVVLYRMQVPYIRSTELMNLVDYYNSLVSSILSKKQSGEGVNFELGEIEKIKLKISSLQAEKLEQKNVISISRIDDKRIGFGQDSNVYEFSLNPGYVYKEGKEGNPLNIEYLRKKYLILRKYLGDVIPKSYFIYGESYTSLEKKRWLKDGSYIGERAITIQRRIKGKDVSKMSFKERQNQDFLLKLEESHKKYVLLKFFISQIIKELGMDKKSMDLQLDLGRLSNRDNFHHDDINFIENELKSPNIMRDGEDVKFIDFGFGEWDNNKQIIFEEMMKDENVEKWKSILLGYGIK
ncbi:MAG: hypothetical protein PHH98_03265 [Candidatus Gracilibacteria bacterium]|nr:hypothetical protein [Candidatus Gracilibacteria bacterium]